MVTELDDRPAYFESYSLDAILLWAISRSIQRDFPTYIRTSPEERGARSIQCKGLHI